MDALALNPPFPLTLGLPHDPRKYREAEIHIGCFTDRLMNDSCTPTSPYLFYKGKRGKWCSPTKPSQGTWVVSSLYSQTTSTRRLGRTEVQVPKGKVLVRWLRRLEVPQLILAWDVRNLKHGSRVGAEDRSNSKACRVT